VSPLRGRFAVQIRSRRICDAAHPCASPLLGLGPYPDVTLSEARDLATRERKKMRQGIDPLTDKRARQIAARTAHENMLTFTECAELYIESQAPGWSNPKHIEQWRSTLNKLAGPIIGHLPVDQIDTALVMRCLEPMWATKTETASRLRGRIKAVLDWSAVRGYRKGDNPARWRGHLDKLLPRPSQVVRVKHHAALPFTDVGAFMQQLRTDTGVASRALEFTILTAARTNEVIQAEWSEFDLDRKTWVVPADVAEMALAHALRDKTEAAYRRGDLFEKRARLMTDWARNCSKPAKPAAVVSIRQNTG